jgi:hypothetical protein
VSTHLDSGATDASTKADDTSANTRQINAGVQGIAAGTE